MAPTCTLEPHIALGSKQKQLGKVAESHVELDDVVESDISWGKLSHSKANMDIGGLCDDDYYLGRGIRPWPVMLRAYSWYV